MGERGRGWVSINWNGWDLFLCFIKWDFNEFSNFTDDLMKNVNYRCNWLLKWKLTIFVLSWNMSYLVHRNDFYSLMLVFQIIWVAFTKMNSNLLNNIPHSTLPWWQNYLSTSYFWIVSSFKIDRRFLKTKMYFLHCIYDNSVIAITIYNTVHWHAYKIA